MYLYIYTDMWLYIHMNELIYKYIYIYMLAQIYAIVVLGAWGARNTQNSRNAVMLNNSKNSKILASTARPGADSLKFWNFLSITAFREL